MEATSGQRMLTLPPRVCCPKWHLYLAYKPQRLFSTVAAPPSSGYAKPPGDPGAPYSQPGPTYAQYTPGQPAPMYYPPVVVAVPAYQRGGVYVEPQAPEEDPTCAFWGMIFAWVCCVGCISFCCNCSAPPGSKRLRYARIACLVSCLVGELSSAHLPALHCVRERRALVVGPLQGCCQTRCRVPLCTASAVIAVIAAFIGVGAVRRRREG